MSQRLLKEFRDITKAKAKRERKVCVSINHVCSRERCFIYFCNCSVLLEANVSFFLSCAWLMVLTHYMYIRALSQVGPLVSYIDEKGTDVNIQCSDIIIRMFTIKL